MTLLGRLYSPKPVRSRSRVEDALCMIVFGTGQCVTFAIEDEAGALKFSDHDRRIDAMQCVARFRGRPANGLMIDDTERTAGLDALVQLGEKGRNVDLLPVGRKNSIGTMVSPIM